MLNLYWEKTPEHVFYDSLLETLTKLELKLVDYTTTEDICLTDIDDSRTRGKTPNRSFYGGEGILYIYLSTIIVMPSGVNKVQISCLVLQ